MAFEKNWRERRIVHRTPGGKMTRVKISSLPADEQQKYNPNRYKRLGADKEMSPDDYAELQKREVDAGHIFDFYIQMSDKSELDDIEEGTLILATTDGGKVEDLFDDDKQIIKLKNVPMDAVKKVVIKPEDEDINYEDLSNVEFEDVGELEGTERYEKIKFNDGDLYQLDVAPFIEFIEVKVDDPDTVENELEENIIEGFRKFVREN